MIKFLICIPWCFILTGCMVTKNLDSNSSTFVRSDSNQRIGVYIPASSKGASYCPDSPSETAKTVDAAIVTALKDKVGDSASVDATLKTAIVNLAQRNTTTNVLIYSLNSLCFLAINGSIQDPTVNQRFDNILKVVAAIAEEDKATAEKARNEAEIAKNQSVIQLLNAQRARQ